MKQILKLKTIVVFSIVLLFFSACAIPNGEKTTTNQLVQKEKTSQDNGQENKEIKNEQTSILKNLNNQSKIKKFETLDELKDFLENNDLSSGSGYSYLSRGLAIENVALETNDSLGIEYAETKSVAVPAAAGGSDDFSKTNVQVEGVDEADIIKTDGKYVYAVVKNDLFIVLAYPADNAEILTKISFKSRPQDIYINGDKLVIYGNDTQVYKDERFKDFRRRSSYTFLKVFDIKDPKEPKQMRDLKFEGGYENSRMIGDYVYFVTNSYNYYYIEDEPVLPRIIQEGEILNDINPDIYYFDISYSSYNFTQVNAINVKDNTEKVKGDVYLMSNTQNMFVSPKNIYLTYTKYISEYDLMMEVMEEIVYPLLDIKDQEKISKIKQVDNFILNKGEKRQKIMRIIENFENKVSKEDFERIENEVDAAMKKKYQDISKELEKTVIHKISINKGELQYKTNGEVTGQVLNQFSMDESNGYFRIATTKNRTWSNYIENDEAKESYSNLYILDENLKQIGAVEGLAKGERIYSVRFMQNRAYLVTFKQIDPLFVIDLSVPTNPEVLGELKIPGFSNYLHPFDENYLIGFGKDTEETEWGGVKTKGLKLSLFDVRDITNLKEVDVYVMGDMGSDSIALHDHKAFLFSKEKNLLMVPVSIRESIGANRWGNLTFSGAAVLTVNENGFELKGKIDHSDGGSASSKDYWNGYNYYDNTVKRSLYIDDTLYTFSNNYLKMNKLDDLKTIEKLKFEKNKKEIDDDFEIIN